MAKELSAQTGKRNVFIRTWPLVQLRLDWPLHLVDRLPDDLTIVLSGPEIKRQEKTKAGGSRDGDLVCFHFEWKKKTRSVQLEATGNGQTVTLWREQVAGNLEAKIEWEERLHPLLGEHPEVKITGNATGAGKVPADLKYDYEEDRFEGLL